MNLFLPVSPPFRKDGTLPPKERCTKIFMELFIPCQGVPLELFPLMQGSPAPPWCSPSYSKVHQGCLEGKIGSFKAFLEGG